MKERTYQNSIVTLFALTWGFVLLDRNAISFLFPVLMKTFNFNNAQTGNIVMVTGLGFVISSLFLTPFADRSGLKKVGIVGLVWALLLPVMANRLGRRSSALILTLFIALSMFIIYLSQGILARIAFVLVVGCCGFVSVLYVAIICQESVPPAIAATTTAIGMAIGELIGTTIAPHILGTMGDLYGFKTVFLVAAVSAMVAFFITFGITETRKGD